MKNMKRILALCLALVMLCVAFAGCGEDKKDNGKDDNNGTINTPQTEERTYISHEAEALITVAEAYLGRRNYIQYCDTRLIEGEPDGIYYRWETAKNTPEDSTAQYTTYSNCAAFCYDVYYQAFGVEIGTWSTQQMMNDSSMHVYKYTVTGTETDEEKAAIRAEYESHLQQGDLIVYRHKDDTNGHVMLYCGDGDIIHCSAPGGGNYDYKNNQERLEPRGAISEMDYETLWNPSLDRYMFSMKNFCVFRPSLKFGEMKVTEETEKRIENLKDIYIEKTASSGAAYTVAPGDEITYTFTLRNSRTTEATVEIIDNVPSNATYVSGAEKADGTVLSWNAKIPAGGTVKLSYTVKVNADAKTNDTVHGVGTVGGVTVKCRPLYVGKHLSSDQQTQITAAVKSNATNSLRGLKLAEKIYADAGITVTLPDEKTLLDSFFEEYAGQYTSLNPGSEYFDIMVPTMYGGYHVTLNRNLYGTWRTKGPLPSQLMTGDIIVCGEANRTQSYMMMGNNLVLDLTAGKELDIGKTVATMLSSIGYDQFVVIRPAMK